MINLENLHVVHQTIDGMIFLTRNFQVDSYIFFQLCLCKLKINLVLNWTIQLYKNSIFKKFLSYVSLKIKLQLRSLIFNNEGKENFLFQVNTARERS